MNYQKSNHSTAYAGGGASQSSGGLSYNSSVKGTFGLGGTATSHNCSGSGGGGGGYYGGGAGHNTADHGSGYSANGRWWIWICKHIKTNFSSNYCRKSVISKCSRNW